MKKIALIFVVVLLTGCNFLNNKPAHRKIHSLNGKWKIAKTPLNAQIPDTFPGDVRVPGLIDMSNPVLDKQDTAYEDAVYWYKKTFSLDHKSYDVVKLKINKSKYHTKVYINGRIAGENYYNFTPSVFNIKPFLTKNAGKKNEIIVAVGCMNNQPDTVIKGKDFEKLKYIPGIYDDVNIILSNKPYISKLHVFPDIQKGQVRVLTDIEMNTQQQPEKLFYTIKEVTGKKVVCKGSYEKGKIQDSSKLVYDFTIPIENFTLWSPENPFLYELELQTKADSKKVKFGMRSFCFNKKKAELNGKPYYLRGTNVCIFRFFEDPNRKDLPWKKEWVVKLHKKFKEMNWNSIRYCIGFPPQMWYDVADSLGFLIQDEYPIWTGGAQGFENIQPGMTAKHLVGEYKEWMKEHNNHACVVIWDAQNESITNVTGKAILRVRDFDLSNRPWDNGWAAPVKKTDCIETHPYLFSRFRKKENQPENKEVLKALLSQVRIPHNGPSERMPPENKERYQNPIIINEYGWIWLNRNGTPTTLTDNVYKNVFSEAKTKQERLETYAKHLAILTEYWRAHRKCAGVLHFCGLGYSRPEPPRGQTSDHFVDLATLNYEPNFYQYVKPAFHPLGVMVEMWDKKIKPKETLSFPVHIINDTYSPWSDTLTITLTKNNQVMVSKKKIVSVDKLGKTIEQIQLLLPAEKGRYLLYASIKYDNETIKSIREFEIP